MTTPSAISINPKAAMAQWVPPVTAPAESTSRSSNVTDPPLAGTVHTNGVSGSEQPLVAVRVNSDGVVALTPTTDFVTWIEPVSYTPS